MYGPIESVVVRGDYLMGVTDGDSEFEVLKYLYRRYGSEFCAPHEIVRRFDQRFSEIRDACGNVA